MSGKYLPRIDRKTVERKAVGAQARLTLESEAVGVWEGCHVAVEKSEIDSTVASHTKPTFSRLDSITPTPLDS
jgi:hypothetical protein